MQMQIIIDRFLRSEKSKTYKLSAYEKIILFILASYMGNKNTCWPSYKSLEIECSLSKRTLIRNIKLLEEKNILKVIRNKDCNNIYEFYPQVVSIGHYLVSIGHHEVVSIRHPNNINTNNIKNTGRLKNAHEVIKNAMLERSDHGSPLFEEMKNKKAHQD